MHMMDELLSIRQSKFLLGLFGYIPHKQCHEHT